MVNGYVNNYPQIQPQQFQAQQTQAPQVASTQPAMTSPINPSAVSINIISPSVYGAQNQAPIPYAPIYSYPQAQTPPPPPVSATATATINQPPAAAPAQESEKDSKKKAKQDIVPLTDTTIKTMENYLNSSNKDTRVIGIKQVLSRFKDDDSRKRDAALTALLNKGLKDQSNDVRTLAMTTIAAGYAAGDDKTLALLTELQSQKTNYNEDALLAAQALAKMSEQAQQVTNPES